MINPKIDNFIRKVSYFNDEEVLPNDAIIS